MATVIGSKRNKVIVLDTATIGTLNITGSIPGYASEAYVGTQISNLVDSSPAALNTLNELAAALGDDPNFATTVSTSIGTKWTQNNTQIANWNTAYNWGNHASAGYVTSSGNTVIGTDTDLSFSGANVLATIALTDGVITSYTNRVLTLANLGYTGETNATADQSAAEILTAIKTVDGSGSGLDADLLDGRQGANIRHINSEYSGSVGTAGWYTIAEYGSGRTQGEFYIYDNDSSRHNFVKIDASWSYGNGGITCTANGKHGTLTITHARFLYNTSDQTYGGCKLQIYCSNPSWTLRVRQMPSQMSGWGAFTQTTIAQADTVSGFAEYSRASNLAGQGGFSTSGNAWYAGGNLVWNAGNDGSGSGLDADLLDGQHGSYYYPASNPSGYNNYTHPAYTTRSLNTSGAQVLDILTTDAIGSVTNATTRTMTLADLGYTGATNANYITNNNQLTNGAGYTTYTANQAVNTNSIVTFNQVYTTNNGAGTNYKIGDDVWIGDINVANTFRVQGSQNAAAGYITFGNNSNAQLGRTGTGALTWDSGTVWYSGNDGSGSGLDADLLDGQHGSYYANEDARKSVPSSGIYQITDSTSPQTLGAGYLRHDFLNSAGPPGSSYRSVLSLSSYTSGSQWTQLSFNYNQGLNTPIYFRQNQYNGSTWSSWHQLWDSANDGSGSGLDADLLDGQQGSYYAPASHNHSGVYNNYTHPAYTARSLNTSGAQVLDILTTDAIGSVTNATTRTMTLANLGYTGATNANYITNNNQLTNGAGYQTTSGSVAQSHYVSGNAFATTGSPSSVLEYQQTSGQTDTKLAPSTDWHNSIRMGHGNPYSYYSNTIALRMTGSGVGDLYTQTIGGGNVSSAWSKHWSARNDGSGSGLDADLLDGQQGSYYAPASSIPSVGNGTLTVTTSGSASGGGTFTANQSGNTTINISATDTNTTYSAGTGITLSGTTFSLTDTNAKLNLSGGTMTGTLNANAAQGIALGSASSRSKLSVYSSGSPYQIGMQSGITYGGLNDWAMTFQFNNVANRGFWWGHDGHSTAQGAMSLTTTGHLFVNSRVDAPTFYDSNNTGYYLNPAETSVINSLVATTINRNPVVTLSGDVTGAATMTNLGSINITTAVGNDSHSHSNYLTSNAADTATGKITFNAGFEGNSIFLNGAQNFDALKTSGFYSLYNATATGHTNAPFQYGAMISANNTAASGGMGMQLAHERTGAGTFIRGMNDSSDTWYAWQRIFMDNYHPNADKWTTLRTLFLTGDVTGSVNWDGSGNATMTTAVGNDSHTHAFNNLTSKTGGTGTYQTSGSFRAPIFYDSNNTGYYVDPASTSRLNDLELIAADSHLKIGGTGYVTATSTSKPGIELGNGQAYPHLTLFSSGTNTNHGGVISFRSALTSGFRRWNIGTANYNPNVIGIGVYDNNDNPHYGLTSVGPSKWTLDNSGNSVATGSHRAPIFYDSNDTNYYVDPASTGTSLRVKGDIVADGNYGKGLVGLYASTRLQNVFSMGTAFRLAADGTTSGNLYGMAWSHPNAGSIGGANNLNDHGLLIINNGVFKAAISSRAVFSADVRGTLFYDYNNTGYYVDASSTSLSINVAGSIVAGGNITAYSDNRIKENIEPITNALGKVQQLNGVTFNRTDLSDKTKRYAGLIAQDIEKVLPEAVEGDALKRVDYNATIGLLVEAIKELTDKVETLELQLAQKEQ